MKGKKLLKTLTFVCIMMVVFTCISAGSFAQAAYEPTKSPIINYFKTSSDNVVPGEIVTLSWRVLGAKEVLITGEEKDIECVLEDSVEVWPLATTVYTLHAYGFDGNEVTASVTVKVGAAEIKNFTAAPAEVAPGEAVTLSWDVYNAESVTVNGVVNQPQGSMVVNPYESTTYTLNATGYDGIPVSTSVSVKVKSPEIISFTADKTEVVPGDTVLLSYDVLYAKSISIEGIEKLPEGNAATIEVWPMVTTTYVLKAEGYDGSVITKEVTVTVKSPIITSFKSSKYEIAKGEMITLSWNTRNAVKCSIEASSGQKLVNVPVNGSIAITPNKDISFTLIATDSAGSQDKKTVNITIK